MTIPYFKMKGKILEENMFRPTVGAAAMQTDENFRKMSRQNVDITSLMKLKPNDAKEFFCGWGAAMINVTVTYPVNKVIFRQVMIFQN